MGPALALATVISLANACVPALPHIRDRLMAHALVESGFSPFAIHDNTTSASYSPSTAYEAWEIATTLVAHGHSIDAGIAQINSANWQRLGLPPAILFNAKANLCAGAVVLIQDYQAACLYNTGRPNCDPNGYPRAIDHAQRVIWDMSRSSAEEVDAREVATDQPGANSTACDALPSDVWGQEACREISGGKQISQGANK